MTPVCGVAALLRPGGPVRVPLRECCVAALVGADGVTTTCAARAAPAPAQRLPASPEPVLENVAATTEASW